MLTLNKNAAPGGRGLQGAYNKVRSAGRAFCNCSALLPQEPIQPVHDLLAILGVRHQIEQ